MQNENLDTLNELSKEQLASILGNMLHVYSSNPEQAKKDHEATLGGRKTYAPYYTSTAAKKVIPLLDRLAQETKNLMLAAKDFGCRPNTLYMRVYHGWEYVIDHMDTPEKKYRKLRRKILLKRLGSVGICMSWKDSIPTESDLSDKAKEITSSIEQEVWQSRMLDFLENGEIGHKFTMTGLNLNEDDVINIQGILSQYPSKLLTHVDESEILIIKMPPDYEDSETNSD